MNFQTSNIMLVSLLLMCVAFMVWMALVGINVWWLWMYANAGKWLKHAVPCKKCGAKPIVDILYSGAFTVKCPNDDHDDTLPRPLPAFKTVRSAVKWWNKQNNV